MDSKPVVVCPICNKPIVKFLDIYVHSYVCPYGCYELKFLVGKILVSIRGEEFILDFSKSEKTRQSINDAINEAISEAKAYYNRLDNKIYRYITGLFKCSENESD